MGAKLHVLRLDLPGLWSDGWLYKENLVLWSRDGLPHVVRLADLAAEVKELATRRSKPLRTICCFTLSGRSVSSLRDFF